MGHKQSKKSKQEKRLPPSAAAPAPFLSRRGKRVIAAGAAAVVVGFFILTLTDPAGRNWASIVSPFLLVAGYALIGVGLVVRDPVPSSPSVSNS
jgi:hypothetical protein